MTDKLGNVGILDIIIGGETLIFSRAVDDVERKLGRLGGKINSITMAAAAFTAAAAAAGAAVFTLAKGTADVADEAGKSAQKLGLTVEAYSSLTYAAKLADVTQEQFSTGVRQLARNMLDAQAGLGDAKDAFKALGFEIVGMDKRLKPTEHAITELADKFSKLKDGPEKTALSMKIFGKAGAELIPFLNQGREGIEELRREAERLGVVISTEAAKAAEEFNDNLRRMQSMAQGVAMEVGGPLVEALGKAMRAFLDARKEGEGFFGSVLEGWRRLATGDDAHKANVEMAKAGDALMKAQDRLDRARRGDVPARAGKSIQDDIRDAELAVRAAEARIQLLAKRNEILTPPAAAAGGKTDAPGLGDAKAEEQRAKEIEDARRKAFGILERQQKESDDAQNKQIASQVQARLTAEETFQIQQQELRQYFADQDAVSGQAQLERRKLLKEFEFKSDEELEIENHASRMARLSDFTNAELSALGGRHEVEQRLEKDHQNRLIDIRATALRSIAAFNKASWQQQTATLVGELSNMTAGVATHNRTLFELNKHAGIANAVINAYIGISKTLATYPYPWNLAMAAGHALVAFAQVQSIRSQSFGGGGGAAPSIAGSTPAPPVTPVSSGAPGPAGGSAGGGTLTVQGITEGELFSGGRVRALIDRLIEAQRAGYKIVLDS